MTLESEPKPQDQDYALRQALHEAALESVLDKRRLRRRMVWWRAFAIILIIGVVVGLAMSATPPVGDHIARYSVVGVITDDPERDALLQDIAEDDAVKALIVRIDSPGGTTVGGEAIYESLRAVAQEKPVVAVMGEVAASAGYITALAADHIVARGNTITASIGVILTAPNVHGAMEKLGISVVEVKSGPQKAEPAPYKPVSEAQLQAERVLIDDSFSWFKGLVRERRGVAGAQLDDISDGRILTGRLALEAGLIDHLGGEADAVEWIAQQNPSAADLPIEDHLIEVDEESLAGLLFGGAAAIGDWGGLAAQAGRLLQGPRLFSQAH